MSTSQRVANKTNLLECNCATKAKAQSDKPSKGQAKPIQRENQTIPLVLLTAAKRQPNYSTRSFNSGKRDNQTLPLVLLTADKRPPNSLFSFFLPRTKDNQTLPPVLLTADKRQANSFTRSFNRFANRLSLGPELKRYQQKSCHGR